MGYRSLEGVFTQNKPGINTYHISVLKDEAVNWLDVKKDGKYIDCTLGGGGHTLEVIKRGGSVMSMDVDSDAIEWVKSGIKSGNYKAVIGENLILVKDNFKNIKKNAINYGFKRVDGIIYDLGVSTHQLKQNGRGFGFQNNDGLDMRMNQKTGESAKDIINTRSKEELYEIFTIFGEEKFAWQIADGIVSARRLKSIETTGELRDIILKTRHRSEKDRTHPATRVFQALRIYVNDELESLRESLPDAVTLIKSGGRIAVISFHSLEDRIVKLFMKKQEREGVLKILMKKPVRPETGEIEFNASSRSGKLRVAQII